MAQTSPLLRVWDQHLPVLECSILDLDGSCPLTLRHGYFVCNLVVFIVTKESLSDTCSSLQVDWNP